MARRKELNDVCPICSHKRERLVDSELFDFPACFPCIELYRRELARRATVGAPADQLLDYLALDSPHRNVITKNAIVRNKLSRRFAAHKCACFRCGHQIKRLRGYAIGKHSVKGIICSTCFHKGPPQAAHAEASGIKAALRRMWLQPYLSENPYVQELLK